MRKNEIQLIPKIVVKIAQNFVNVVLSLEKVYFKYYNYILLLKLENVCRLSSRIPPIADILFKASH